MIFAFNASRNTLQSRLTEHFYLLNHDSQTTKKPDHGFTKIPLPPPPFRCTFCGIFESQLNRPVLDAKTIIFHPWLLCISNNIYFSVYGFFFFISETCLRKISIFNQPLLILYSGEPATPSSDFQTPSTSTANVFKNLKS